MATEILPAREADGQLFHQPRPRRSPPSSSSLFLGGSTAPASSGPKPALYTEPAEHNERIRTSLPISSLDSSPRPSALDLPRTSPYTPNPMSSSMSLEDKSRSDDDLDFPNYDSLPFSHPDEGYDSSYRRNDEDSEAPEISTSTSTTLDDSPLPTPTIVDDTAIKQEPSRHVDYLSHNWREEDIWASWRHIVSQRKYYGQKSRLENASWRTWAKSKYHLRTVSPETLNWLKESDVTWLYGPLKPATTHPITSDASEDASSQISKNSSFVNKKPILKKRSVSEVMLQKSLSNSSLVRQAATAAQAQQSKPGRTRPSRLHSSSTVPSNPPSRDETDYFSSRSNSNELESPSESTKEKHIRFDEKVEQCIAVECKESVFDESEPDIEDDPPNSALSDSSSDEGLFMMNKRHVPRRESLQKGKIGGTSSTTGQMIETLPSTTLKYRTDSPDVTQEAQQHHVFGKGWGASKLSPSPSQETLRPSRPSRNFLIGRDDDDGEPDASSSWSFGSSNPNSSLGASVNSEPPRRGDFRYTDGYDGIEGMRRTESGMFMPYDEDEDDRVAEGLFGRVSETINTFRDIGHVIFRSAFS